MRCEDCSFGRTTVPSAASTGKPRHSGLMRRTGGSSTGRCPISTKRIRSRDSARGELHPKLSSGSLLRRSIEGLYQIGFIELLRIEVYYPRRLI